MARKIVNILNKVVDIIVLAVVLIVLIYGVYSIYDIFKISKSTRLADEILYLKPDSNSNNDNFSRLREYNENIFAWIELDNTNIDYPVVKGDSNSEYINKGYNEEFSLAGAIFLDYRNSTKLTDRYSVIYGHHFEYNLLFGDLDKYKSKKFFEKNNTGRIYLEDKTYELDIFASVVVPAYDNTIFTINKEKDEKMSDLIEHIKKSAINYKDVKIDSDTKIIAFVTCTNEITSGRLIVFAKILDK